MILRHAEHSLRSDLMTAEIYEIKGYSGEDAFYISSLPSSMKNQARRLILELTTPFVNRQNRENVQGPFHPISGLY